MRIFTSLSVLALSLFFSSDLFSQNSHFLTVNFEGGSDNGKVYLYSNKGRTDSTLVTNRQARFSLTKMGNEWEAYYISYKCGKKDYSFPVFHNAQSDIAVLVDSQFYNIKFSGGVHSDEQNEFYSGLYRLYEKRLQVERKLNETNDLEEKNALKAYLLINEQQYQQYCLSWVTQHNSSPFSVLIIRSFINKTNILNELDTLATKYYDQLLPQAHVNNYESFNLQTEFAKYSDAYSFVPVTSTAPEFAIKDTMGKAIKLSAFKGKWVLVDFWASWCAPCRQNNPLIKELHTKYQGKGLEVLSISMDTERKKWKDAIIKDKMTWHQGSDHLGMGNGVGRSYQISAVPIYFLISPEGKIVTKSLGGDIQAVEKVLQGIL